MTVTISRELDLLLADRDRLHLPPAAPCGLSTLQFLDNAFRDLLADRLPWPADRCPGCLAETADAAYCPGCGAPTDDLLARILRAPYPGVLDAHMRRKSRKEFAAAVRKMLTHFKLKGISVTAPTYSMASSIDVRVPHKSGHLVDEGHPFDDVFRTNDGGVNWDHEHQYRNCPRCQRRHRAEQKLETMILCAFPDCDDRSDAMIDHFDFRFLVSL